jgi:hypothetical protein
MMKNRIEMKFTMPFVLKNPLNGSVGHWSKRAKQRSEDRLRCGQYILAAIGKNNTVVGKRRVIITLYRPPHHALDRVGAYASIKTLEDSLVSLGHLRNDNDEWCDTQVLQVDAKQRQTEVEICDLE